jgi:hypothetical protein
MMNYQYALVSGPELSVHRLLRWLKISLAVYRPNRCLGIPSREGFFLLAGLPRTCASTSQLPVTRATTMVRSLSMRNMRSCLKTLPSKTSNIWRVRSSLRRFPTGWTVNRLTVIDSSILGYQWNSRPTNPAWNQKGEQKIAQRVERWNLKFGLVCPEARSSSHRLEEAGWKRN